MSVRELKEIKKAETFISALVPGTGLEPAQGCPR